MLRSRLVGIATAVGIVGAMVMGTPAAQADEQDTTPPTIAIISPVENQQVPIGVEPLPTVQYTCDDDVAVATCAASIGPVNGENPPLTVGNGMPLDLHVPGQYLLTVTSLDTSGNSAQAATHFQMVQETTEDDVTAPSIEIQAPMDGAQVKKSASLIAVYSCYDKDSDIDSCDGPVSSVAAVDTATLGLKDFTVVARDKAGNESSETVRYEVVAPVAVTVSGTIKDIAGNLLPGSTVQARLAGTSDIVAATEANTNGVYSLTLPAGTYDMRYRSRSGVLLGAELQARTYLSDKSVNVVLGPIDPDPVEVSGVVTDAFGDPVRYAYINLGSAGASTDAQGRYSLLIQPGSYSIQAQHNGVILQRNITIEDSPTTLDLHWPARPASVLVHVVDADGQAITGPPMVPGAERQKSFLNYNCTTAPIDADGSGQPWTLTQNAGGVANTPMTVLANAHCTGLIRLPDFSREIAHQFDTTDQPLEYTITDTPPKDTRVEVSGVVTDAFGDPVRYAYINLGSAGASTDAQGRYSLLIQPGSYSIQAQHNGVILQRNITIEDSPTTLDLHWPARPASVLVHVVDADGQAITGPPMVPGAERQKSFLNYNCTTAPIDADGSGQPWTLTQNAGGVANTPMTVLANAHCTGLIRLPDFSREIANQFDTTDQPVEYTVFRWGGSLYGGTEDTNDGDNVADLVEALAPNNGDGNNDGTPDYEQQNVTSLPVNGSGLGDGANYLTVAAPAGTELSNVFTIDPTDTTKVETPPPPGVTLPEGLTNLVLKGVESGTDQTISIFTSSTQDVTGYAKYDPNTKQWSLLPDNRVKIFDNRVEITLTDGGIGDDDRQANGRISDPGGIAIVKNLDTVAPTVTGTATSQPNANGWYNDDVTVKWTANDPEPSSGLSGDPANTVIDGEGDDLSAESAQACDTAGNCSTGSVRGVKIDRTKPSVDITGIKDGATYTLGAAPTAACSATDGLSGVDDECVGASTGGNANGVGAFTYTARATDLAGNVRTATASYQVVYRFDGFMQPINDPALVPSAARSVFKSGSNVPVKFQVKRADGTLIDPVTAPEWLIPEKGAATAATVNEATWSEPATSGTQFEKSLNQWQYNWKTKGVAAGYTYRIGVRLDDGTKHYVVVASK